MKKLVIPFVDYKRIFRTIYSILLHENPGQMNHSCVPFSIIGAFILHEHYKINAKVSMGIASYLLDEEKMNVLAFAEKEESHLTCSQNGFHSWIEANESIIDFTAPLFPKIIKIIDQKASCKSKMFQKPLKNMRVSVSDLKKTGDFFVGKDIVLSDQMVDKFLSRPLHTDLIEICCKWYKRPPRRMLESIGISNSSGNIKKVTLKPFYIQGSWQ